MVQHLYSNKIIKTMLCLVLILGSTLLKAQDSDNDPSKFLPKITPPSPEAFKFSLYGNTPVGMVTGAPTIQLPLFTYKTSNLTVPFSLNYSSNGIKVDDVNTKTGLGWNLIGGGVITRTVRNLEDDLLIDFPLKHFDVTTVDKTNSLHNVYFNLFGENQGKDCERDLYVFNFLNYSGKFYFDDNNKIVFIDKSDIKIDVIFTPGDPIFSFVVTTLDGTKFFFNDEEQTMLRTYGGSQAEPSLKYTAWYLTKIVHPKGDEIYFNYVGSNQYYVQSQSQQASRSYHYLQHCAPSIGYSKQITFGPIYSHTIRVIGKTIQSISSNTPSAGTINFEYEDKILSEESEPDDVVKTITVKDKDLKTIEKIDFDYLLTANKRIFLTGYHFLDPSNKYAFEYINPSDFPVRLSKSQDHWGYFNGSTNTMLLPKGNDYGFENYVYDAADREVHESSSKIGLLNKIAYPTKGYTNLEYESNDYYGTKRILPPITSAPMLLENNADERLKSTTLSFTAGFSYTAKFIGSSYFSNCTADLDTGLNHHRGYITVFCVEDNDYVEIFQYSAFGIQLTGENTQLLTADASVPYYFNVVQNKNYIVKLTNNYNCIHSNIQLDYYVGVPQNIQTNLVSGGLRVKTTKDYSLYSVAPQIKKYFYSKFSQPTISSGDILVEPNYFNFSDHIATSNVNELSCTVTDVVLNSSSISSLFEMGSTIFYRYVTVSNGENFENGYEENEFIVNKDYREQIYLGDREFKNVPWSNLGWNNGKLVKSTTFEKRNSTYFLRKEVVNDYLNPISTSVVNFAIYNPTFNIFTTNTLESCECTQATINESYPVKYCTAIHFHQKDTNGNCIASNSNTISTLITHPCYGKSIGQVVGIPTINHMDIMPYKYVSYFQYLGSTITKEYDKNGTNPLTTVVNYNYSSPNHLQLTSQTTLNSKGENVARKYLYSKDPEMSTMPFVSELVAHNMIGTPLNTQVYNSGNKISEQLTVYAKDTSTANLLLPKSVYSAKFPNSLSTLPVIGALEKKITYDLYDATGNLTQYTPEGGAPVSIVWGYDKTQPIGKIENATNAQLVSALGVTNFNAITEAQISSLNNLRTNATFSQSMITTYTYQPLVGVTSITDPKGDTVYYTYDGLGRLQYVKDAQGKLLTDYQYHYKN